METNNIELFDAYVSGKLTPEEQLQVETQLRTDEAFKQDYGLYQLMISAIAENRKTELKSFISKNVRIVKPVQFFRTPTFYAAAAASVVLCMLSYFVIYKKLTEEKMVAQKEEEKAKTENTIIPNPDSSQPVAQNKTKETGKETPSSTTVSKTSTEQNGGTEMQTDDLKRNSETVNTDNGVSTVISKAEDIKVEGDKMQSDTFLFIPQKIYIPKPKQYQSNPNDITTVITAGDKRKIEVQFWQSPVNYSGYRFTKDLLIIYGNYDPSLASFQELKDIVYMKYKNEYFRMSASETYCTFKKETDSKIIADLETK